MLRIISENIIRQIRSPSNWSAEGCHVSVEDSGFSTICLINTEIHFAAINSSVRGGEVVLNVIIFVTPRSARDLCKRKCQAAFLTGKSRETINKATLNGKVTYTENEEGAKVIDVSELERAYKLVRTMDDLKLSEVVNDSQTASSTPSDLKELAVVKVRLDAAIRLKTVSERSMCNDHTIRIYRARAAPQNPRLGKISSFWRDAARLSSAIIC